MTHPASQEGQRWQLPRNGGARLIPRGARGLFSCLDICREGEIFTPVLELIINVQCSQGGLQCYDGEHNVESIGE